MMTKKLIQIRPYAKHHGLFICLCGLFTLLFLLWLSQSIWQQAKLPMMFLVYLTFAILLLGVNKLLEPKYSVVITPECLTYHHKKGHWRLSWQDIRAIFAIKNTNGINLEQLDYFGFTLSSIDVLIGHISPRLANQLIHEQKPLLAYCLSSRLITQEQAVMNFNCYTSEEGLKIKGPVAGFLHQCTVLHLALGAHLYIARVNIDRPLDEFVSLLKSCQASCNQSPSQ